jgi:HPt (histidine-containing phosphotransfer) domain-containing protein
VTDADRLHPDFADLWPGSRGRIDEALAGVTRGVEALESASLTEGVRAEAERHAHKLVGTLGTYGLLRCAALARQLEDSFSAGPPPPDAAQVRDWLDALHAGVRAA